MFGDGETTYYNSLRKADTSVPLFIKKLAFCSQDLDYSDPASHPDRKAERMIYIQDILLQFQSPKSIHLFILPNLRKIFFMIQQNLLTKLWEFQNYSKKIPTKYTREFEDLYAPKPKNQTCKIEKHEYWYHLEPVYQIFALVIDSDSVITFGALKKYLQPNF